MLPNVEYLVAHDGLHLAWRRWPRDESPGGVPPAGAVALLHGYAEHSGRYAHVAHALNAQGWDVWALDLRGHGQSAGPRAYVRAFDDYLDDAEAFLDLVRRQAPSGRLFLLAHSMGGVVAALLAALRQPRLAGLLLSAPAVAINPGLHPALQRMSGWLGAWLPYLPTVRPELAALSRDPAVIEAFRQDPLCYQGRMPARTGAELLLAARRASELAPSVETPLLVLHGTADRLAMAEGSQRLFARAGSADKRLRLYEGLFHEILQEPEREQVLDDIVAWLAARLGKPDEG